MLQDGVEIILCGSIGDGRTKILEAIDLVLQLALPVFPARIKLVAVVLLVLDEERHLLEQRRVVRFRYRCERLKSKPLIGYFSLMQL